MTEFRSSNPIFVALDVRSVEQAQALAMAVKPYVGGLKVGLEFINACGPEGVRKIIALGLPVFIDVKLHDIPNTVAAAIRSLSPLAPAFINVHASGGSAMMQAAAKAAGEFMPRPKLLAVTVLTSLEAADLETLGVSCTPIEQVSEVRSACGPDFLIITPGIRPAGATLGDQRRVMAPVDALAAGANFLVIGRPITAEADPAAVAKTIIEDL
jgi:orotidine-5'-phosphate decarboxylase